jgi:hypothetical protein
MVERMTTETKIGGTVRKILGRDTPRGRTADMFLLKMSLANAAAVRRGEMTLEKSVASFRRFVGEDTAQAFGERCCAGEFEGMLAMIRYA